MNIPAWQLHAVMSAQLSAGCDVPKDSHHLKRDTVVWGCAHELVTIRHLQRQIVMKGVRESTLYSLGGKIPRAQSHQKAHVADVEPPMGDSALSPITHLSGSLRSLRRRHRSARLC